VGVCQGEKLLLHDSGTGLIHGRHRQGGSSAARFQRRRKDQTHHFLERVSEHLQEQLEPYARTLDYFIFGGARVTILRLQKQCPFLAQFENRLLPAAARGPGSTFYRSGKIGHRKSGPARLRSGKKRSRCSIPAKAGTPVWQIINSSALDPDPVSGMGQTCIWMEWFKLWCDRISINTDIN